MTSKLKFILLIITGLLLAALLTRSQTLALLTLPFLFYLGGGILTTPSALRLAASRSLDQVRCQEGSSITMTLVVENQGSYIPRLRIVEKALPKMRLTAGELEVCASLPAGEQFKHCFTFHAPRGKYDWSTVRVTASDPFGLFEETLELPATAQVLVLPGQLPLHRLPLAPRQTIRTPGPNLSRLPGAGVDFYGVRAYHPGDSLRWIHWRLSARHPGQLFTREFEREEMADIGIILDGCADPNNETGGVALVEHSIQAAAALSKNLLRAGNRLSLLILGERILRVFPDSGKRQSVRILDALAACQPGNQVSLKTLTYLPVQLFPARTLVIVISPLRSGSFSAFLHLRAAGYQVLLLSPNPVRFAAQYSRQPVALRAAQLERTAILWRIRELGVQVVDWSVDSPLFDNFAGLRLQQL